MGILINILTMIAAAYLGVITLGIMGFILIFLEIRRRNKETKAMRERFNQRKTKHQIKL